jgi:hypothetical protein
MPIRNDVSGRNDVGPICLTKTELTPIAPTTANYLKKTDLIPSSCHRGPNYGGEPKKGTDIHRALAFTRERRRAF